MKKQRYKVVFVVRGGRRYGMGHFVRSLSLGTSLAKKLGDAGQFLTIANNSNIGKSFSRSIEWPVRFINFETNGNLEAFIRCWSGIKGRVTILDYLDVSEEEKRIVSSYSDKIIFFDDMEQSDPHKEMCHAVIQSQNCDPKKFRGSIKGKGILYLRGPRYFILPSSFDEYIRKKKGCSQYVASVFVSIGGSNYQGAIAQIAKEIRSIFQGRITIAGGFDPTEGESLRDSLKDENINLLSDNKHFAKELFHSDLAVIAGGFAKYEAAALGVPSLILGFQDHQETLSRKFESSGCGKWIGIYSPLALKRMKEELMILFTDFATRSKMADKGKELIPKNGIDEVVPVIMGFLSA